MTLRVGLVEMAERLRRQARRWGGVATQAERHGRRERAQSSRYVAQVYGELADIAEQRSFLVELGAGFAKPKRPAPKPAKKETTADRIVTLLAAGPLTATQIVLLVGLAPRTVYPCLADLERAGRIVHTVQPPQDRKGPQAFLWHRKAA